MDFGRLSFSFYSSLSHLGIYIPTRIFDTQVDTPVYIRLRVYIAYCSVLQWFLFSSPPLWVWVCLRTIFFSLHSSLSNLRFDMPVRIGDSQVDTPMRIVLRGSRNLCLMYSGPGMYSRRKQGLWSFVPLHSCLSHLIVYTQMRILDTQNDTPMRISVSGQYFIFTTERSRLQHTATHCNTLQHTATHCNAQHRRR